MANCCQDVFQGDPGPVPFSQVVGLGFYDGILAGLLKCGRCGREFKFDNLYENLDGPVRFFSLASLPSGSVDRFANAVGRYQNPQWPIWVPLWTFPTDEIKRSLDLLSEEIRGAAGGPDWVLAWDLGSNQIVACRPFPMEHAPEDPKDWIAFCGIPQSVAKYPDQEME